MTDDPQRRPFSWDFQPGRIHELQPSYLDNPDPLESLPLMLQDAVKLSDEVRNLTIDDALGILIRVQHAEDSRPSTVTDLEKRNVDLSLELSAHMTRVGDLEGRLARTTAQRDNWEKSARATREEVDELNQQLAKGHEEYLKLRRQVDDAVDILAMTPQRGQHPPRSRAEQVVMLQQLFEES